MTDHASTVKERVKVAEDMHEVRANLLSGIAAADPEHAAKLKSQADAVVIEEVDFGGEANVLTARFPEIQAANRNLAGEIGEMLSAAPRTGDAAIDKRLARFGRDLGEFRDSLPERESEFVRWRGDRTVSFGESLHAFAFGREWITASFWQDWYGVLPLFFGSDTNNMTSLTAMVLSEVVSWFAIPIYAWLLVQGFRETHSRVAYGLQLFILAVVCEVPYDLATSHKAFDLGSQNPVFGLFVAFVVLAALDWVASRYQKAMKVLLSVLKLTWICMLA